MKKRIKTLDLFIIISAASVIISLFVFMLVPDMISSVSALNIKNIFNDFVFHLYHSKDLSTIYTKSIHICFPPLIYLFYHILNLFLPPQTDENIQFEPMYFLCAIYLIIGFLAFAFTVKRFFKTTNDNKIFLVIVMITLSSSFVFGIIECANIAFLVLILLLLAIDFRESESKIKQELAMIFIAIAAAIKVYPAIFGLLYIAERKYKKAIRLVIYGLLFFFVPFAFTGGIEGFNLFIDNQIRVQSVWGTLSQNGIFSNLVSLGITQDLAKAMIYVFGGLSFVLFFVYKDSWKRIFLLCFVMVMCPLWSGAYTASFFIIPFFTLISKMKNITGVMDFIYIIAFSAMFTSSCYSFDFSSRKIFFASIIIFFVLIADEIYIRLSNKKSFALTK